MRPGSSKATRISDLVTGVLLADWRQRSLGPVGFSAKITYGLLALMELARVQAAGERLQVAEIAARQGIPERYLEQMMTALRRGGLVRSCRGPRGGYQLLRSPAELPLAEVIRCLEGKDSEPERPRSPEQAVLAGLAAELRQQRFERLNSTSLAQLLQQRDALLQPQTMYFI